MNNYDEWKTDNNENDKDNECEYCGEPCEKSFCNDYCKKGYAYDMLEE